MSVVVSGCAPVHPAKVPSKDAGAHERERGGECAPVRPRWEVLHASC
jgi:hypothetical protein